MNSERIILPPKIKGKIEDVQAAKQDVTIAEQQKERAKQEAQTRAEVARGEAEKNRIEAQGEADKIRIEAEEQAKANTLISQFTDRGTSRVGADQNAREIQRCT